MLNKNELFFRLTQLLNSIPKDISGSVTFNNGRCRVAAVLVIIHYKFIDNDNEDNNNWPLQKS